MLSSLTNKVRLIRLSRIEVLLVLSTLTFGTFMVVLIPPGAGYDEEDHLVRVWELSLSSFIPGQLSPQEMRYPIVFRDFAYRQQGSTGVIDAEFWQTYGRASLYESGYARREIDTKSVYSPALLLPQAIAMRIFGRSIDLAALPVFYLCRLAGLLSYLALVWLALRLLPTGKWILLVLALTPMALYQATTISPDAISNGIGFLFIAGCLRINESQEIGWRHIGYLLVLIFLLFLAKLNLVPLVLLPFLLILPGRFSQKVSYVFLVIATLLLFVVEVAGWNLITSTKFNSLLLTEANPKAQLLSILANPFRFLWIAARDFITHGLLYLEGWINGYGYYYWTPPAIVSILFLLSLGTAVLTDSTSGRLPRKIRGILLFIFFAGYVATVVSLYMSFTPVGLDQIYGVQGRYFIPLALLLFLAISSPAWASKFSINGPKWAIILLSGALLLNILGLYLSFHVECGSTFYRAELCYRPLSRDFTDTRPSLPLSAGTSLKQELQVKCDGLTEMRVLLLPSTPGDPGVTRIILHDPTNNQTLLDTSMPNNNVSAEDWYPLRFEPDWGSAGKTYILSISGQGTLPDQGVQVLYTAQSEFDSGNLYVNEELTEENIVLQYGCATGLRRFWLTGSFR